MIDQVKALSRPLAVANAVSGRLVASDEVKAKRVVLTADRSVLGSANGRWALLDSLRLLLRVTGNLTLLLPAGSDELEREMKSIAASASLVCKVEFLRAPDEEALHDADAILNVGFSARPELPWTCISSNGWVVRADSTGMALTHEASHPNPIGALGAASIGVAEIFKRLFGIPDEVAPLQDKCEFSLFELSRRFDSPGPQLPRALHLPNTLIGGGGAIANGVGLLLSQLPLLGRVHIVDKQAYGDENFGTCVLLEEKGWIGEDKAPRFAEWLKQNSALEATGERALINAALSGEEVRALAPELIINGFDDVAARHDVQLAWPGLLLDGGISDIGFAVVQHRPDERGLACLRCTFESAKVDHRLEQRGWTGLTLESLGSIDRLLTDDDIARADPEKRAWLEDQRRLKKNVCSIINEARLAVLGVNVEEGFRPSVPFVATASAVLVVAEMIKALMFPQRAYPQTFTVGNVFLGFDSAAALTRAAAPRCECVTHRSMIESLKARRAARKN